MINILEIISINICLIFLIYYYTVAFVKNYYDPYRLYLIIKDNIKNNIILYVVKGLILLSSIITLFFVDNNLIALLYLSNALISLIIVKKGIIKITRRFIFQFGVSILFLALIDFLIISLKNMPMYLLIAPELITIIFIYLSLLINYPLEELIRTYYIKKAKNRINGAKKLKIIGITGSYGKTTFKNFLAELLNDKCVIFSPGNINTLMGLTKFINTSLTPFDEYLIVEIGVDKLNGMKKFKCLFKLDYAVITSVGPQHLLTLKNIDNIYKVKTDIAYLLKKDGTIFYNSDTVKYSNKFDKYKSVSYSSKDYKIINSTIDSTTINFDEICVKTKLKFESSVLNAFGAYKVAKQIGINNRHLITKLENLEEISRRKNITKCKNQILVDDSYNVNFYSAKESINYILKLDGKKCCITAGLVELGKERKKYLKEFGKILAKLDMVIFVNNEFSSYIKEGYLCAGGCVDNVIKFKKYEEALSYSKKYDVVLLLSIGEKYNLI